jgi:hypothetical protein
MEAWCGTDPEATPVEILPWVVRRWSVEVTCDAARAHLGFETQRQWSDHAITRTTPVLWGLFARVTLRALRLSQSRPIPVPTTAWDHTGAPTLADCLAWVRQHLWRARDFVKSTPEAACMPCPREMRDLLSHGFPLAA